MRELKKVKRSLSGSQTMASNSHSCKKIAKEGDIFAILGFPLKQRCVSCHDSAFFHVFFFC